MRDVFLWYLTTLLLGMACLPITTIALRGLPDRGWSLAKPLALLLFGVACWLPPIVIHALPYSRGWIIFVALILVAVNATILMRRPAIAHQIGAFVRQRWAYVVGSEVVFAGGMWLMGWLRTFNPKVESTEKFMDQAFVSAIMRAQYLPPPDPWYAGQPINYYYFGHFLIATLAKLLNTAPSVAFNVGIALTAGLAAIAIFGVAANLSATILAPTTQGASSDEADPARGRLALAMPFGVLAAMVALVLGNLRSFALWWERLPDPRLNAAGNWLQHSATWQFFDWWGPSRALPNNVITEFPSFSFLLADLHAHVLALPYAVMTLGIALNFWRLPAERGIAVLGTGWDRWLTVAVAVLGIGSLFLMNGWDLPTYAGIALLAVVLHQWRAHDYQFTGELARNCAILGGGLLVGCLVPFLPFWLTFSSPGQGLGLVFGAPDHLAPVFTTDPNAPPVDRFSRSAIGDVIAIFGLSFFVLASWLLALTARRLVVALPVVMARPAAVPVSSDTSGTLAFAANEIAPPARQIALTGQRTPETWSRAWGIVGVIAASLAWLTWVTARWDLWTLLWLGGAIALAIWLIIDTAQRGGETTILFPLLLLIAGAGVIALCEVVYLRDIFVGYSPRMNTIFKFYFQAWTILSIAATAALAWMVRHLVDRLPAGMAAFQPVAWSWQAVWGLGLAAMLAMSSIYPLGASHALYLRQPAPSSSLVGLLPGALPQSDLDAIAWLNAHISGSPVIVEANSDQADYSPTYGRISTFTGLPTILGWRGHEDQWRLNWMRDPHHAADYAPRFSDIQQIYISGDQEHVLRLVRLYHVAYIYVGPLEEQTYQSSLRLDRLQAMFPVAYQHDGVMIFAVPDSAQR